MEDGDKFLTKEEISFLNQLIKSLEESRQKLEEYYMRKDYKNFKNIKRFMLEIQKKISEAIK